MFTTKAYEKARAAALLAAKGKSEFQSGDYVLLHSPRPDTADKLTFMWTGPYLVKNKIDDPDFKAANLYVIQDLVTQEEKRVHASQLHIFYTGQFRFTPSWEGGSVLRGSAT